MRQKIDFGIDLGTTNSAIAYMQDGEAVIVKSDVNQMDTTPSCVTFNKRKNIWVGLNAKQGIEEDAKRAFKNRKQNVVNVDEYDIMSEVKKHKLNNVSIEIEKDSEFLEIDTGD